MPALLTLPTAAAVAAAIVRYIRRGPCETPAAAAVGVGVGVDVAGHTVAAV